MPKRIGNGAGRGGPAKGGGGNELQPFQPGNKAATMVRPDRAERREWRAEAAWRMENMLLLIAEDALHPASARVSAAEKLHAICEGKPQQSLALTGAEGGPVQSVNLNTNDPVEAAKIYQAFISAGR